ncbi:MAG: MBL fold metallo-hydrolase [Candidatus Saccharimonadales bacterium]
MDLQFFGANCVTITTKNGRIVVDDNLADLGGKTVAKNGDMVLYSGQHGLPGVDTKLLIDSPGEYELSGFVIKGIAARAHIDEIGQFSTTIYKVTSDDVSVVITGHIDPEIGANLVEQLAGVDVLCLPVGGNGYTLDGLGALQIIKQIEPNVVIPTHYQDQYLKYSVPQQNLSQALQALAMETKATLQKLRIKPADFGETSELIVLERS